MNALLLSGNSLRNKDWIHQLDSQVAPLFGKTLVHEYLHWQTGQPLIDLDAELKLLEPNLPELGEYVIIAKSAGSVLALKGINQRLLSPAKCFFMGLPLAYINEQILPAGQWLAACQMPVMIIQNSFDPVGSYQAAKDYLLESAASQCQLIEVAGDSHDYEDYPCLKQLLADFLR